MACFGHVHRNICFGTEKFQTRYQVVDYGDDYERVGDKFRSGGPMSVAAHNYGDDYRMSLKLCIFYSNYRSEKGRKHRFMDKKRIGALRIYALFLNSGFLLLS